MIKWINEATRKGMATVYPTNITFNSTAKVFLQDANMVIVGVDDSGDIMVKPLSKSEVERCPSHPSFYEISNKRSYARISSTSLVSSLVEMTGMDLSSGSVHLECSYDESENVLRLSTGRVSEVKNG